MDYFPEYTNILINEILQMQNIHNIIHNIHNTAKGMSGFNQTGAGVQKINSNSRGPVLTHRDRRPGQTAG